MFHVKNLRTGNMVKDAINGKKLAFADQESAEKIATGLNVFAVAGCKRDRYLVVKSN